MIVRKARATIESVMCQYLTDLVVGSNWEVTDQSGAGSQSRHRSSACVELGGRVSDLGCPSDPDGRELSPAEELRMMRVADGSPQHERQFGPVGVDAPADGSLGGLALQPDTAGAGDHRRVDGVPSAGVEFVDCLLVRTTMVSIPSCRRGSRPSSISQVIRGS